MIEKSLAEQERIVGELLQPGGVMKLKEMGLAHLLEDFDARVHSLCALLRREAELTEAFLQADVPIGPPLYLMATQQHRARKTKGPKGATWTNS